VSKDTLLRTKILKIIGILFFARIGLYIPVPGTNFISLSRYTLLNPLLSGPFLSIGSLGILPYLNASLVVSLLLSVFNEKQGQDRMLSPKQIKIYTRYATLFWSVILSIAITLFSIKPVLFEWSFLIACKISFSLCIGSILYMWFSELITDEGIGNGSSLVIFSNIVTDIPNSTFQFSVSGVVIYFLIFLVVINLQCAYKRIPVVSAKSLNSDRSFSATPNLSSQEYIPFKLNQGGITPLVFSSSLTPIIISSVQSISNFFGFVNGSLDFPIFFASSVLLIFFNCTYTSLAIDFMALKEKLNSQAYIVANAVTGVVTARYFEKICYRLAIISGFFLAVLIFFSRALTQYFSLPAFVNLTTLSLLIGVVIETISQVKGYIFLTRYGD
jgi:preprotein translocase subunit SecY